MLKLYERLPQTITVDGKRYALDLDFRNVLKMLDFMQREDILPEARDFLCARCVCKKPPKQAGKLYNALCAMLFPVAPETGEKRLITSYEQDSGLIRAAFRQVYGIDLFRDSLHWFEFTELLSNIPEGNRYEEVLGIRARPLPAPNKYNAKEREWLMKAKQSVALHLTEREQARKYESDVAKVFAGLFGIIQKADAKEVNSDGG